MTLHLHRCDLHGRLSRRALSRLLAVSAAGNLGLLLWVAVR